MQILCANCRKPITRNWIKKAINHFCSAKCHRTYRSPELHTCFECGVMTYNPKFCCQSCATSFNNRIAPKRKKSTKVNQCKFCDKPVGSRRGTVCKEHNKNNIDWSQVTYAELKARYKYQRNSRIRDLARSAYNKSGAPKHCAVCGYDRNYHVSHKKPVNKFTPDSSISEINDLSNLIALCPNHHWEFDNGLLPL